MATGILDPSRLQTVFGTYRVGNGQALSDPFIPLKAQEYRRNLASRMIALDRVSVKEKLPACDCFVSRKVDGECSLLLIEADQCFSINPGGVVRTRAAVHAARRSNCSARPKHKKMLLAGELVSSPHRPPAARA